MSSCKFSFKITVLYKLNHPGNLSFCLVVSGHSLLKDVVVAFSVLVATVGCWVAVLQKRKAKEQMERMIKDMKILQQAEDGLQELQLRYVRMSAFVTFYPSTQWNYAL